MLRNLLIYVLLSANVAIANDDFIVVQSTTSTLNSGLYDHILPIYNKKSGINVKVVAVGTGQALKNAKQCDGDVLIVHAKNRELDFVNDGYGTERKDLMHNDFVIIGPKNDPAEIKTLSNISSVFRSFFDNKNKFISRADDSGTHILEKELWVSSNINPENYSGKWYLEAGAGMGATITIAVNMNAYTISDRATWVAYKNKQNHEILFSGDKKLFNQYGVILVNPSHCPNAKLTQAKHFRDWLLSENGKKAISSHKVNGIQLFYPN